MKVFLPVILVLPILAFSQQLAAQGREQSILNPANSSTNTIEEQGQLEERIRQIQESANQPKNSLDQGMINKSALDFMAVEFQQEPSIMKDMLKLTEVEFESILMILVGLRSQSASAVRSHIISMCNSWNVDSSNIRLTKEVRVSRALNAYEDSKNYMNLQLTSTYDNALPFIYAEASEESKQLIDSYLDTTRSRLQRSVVRTFTDSVKNLGASAEANIEHHCEQ